MNALELADELQNNPKLNWQMRIAEASTMLRTIPVLQAENEALRNSLKQVIRISDRKHDAWDKAKELLK